MLNLIRNEWMKLWHKKATWIMAGLLVIILIGITGISKWADDHTVKSPDQPTWKENAAERKAYITAELANPNISDDTKKQLEEELTITEYRLTENVAPYEFSDREQNLMDSYQLLALVLMFSVIAAASIVASEFSQGTIKMLLSRPVKRWKILTSKYVTSLLYAIALTIIALIANVIAGYIFFDATGTGALLEVRGGEVVEVSYWNRVLALYGLQFIGIMVFTTFAFMIGSVFRTSSLAIGLSIFLMFMGPNIVYFLRNYEFTKYIMFTHTDLTGYLTGNMFIPGITWPLSAAVLTVYVVLFLVISYWSFTKRDVTA
ncbi:ABC transporter permease [Paenisporosarcina sp.]|uniref:ABC transporter permease n=1 Tax=Paenisporosarcina sp. TaxID=1932001 RepID=UPI003C795296